MTPTTKNLEGKPHMIVPVILGVTGVWAGSNGPLYYPADELRKSVDHWNGKVLVAYHPTMQTGGAANNPKVFNEQKIGHVFNCHFDGKRLKGEAWIDIARAAVVDPRILAAVRAGKVLEVSTGLYTNNEAAEGTYGGVAYQAIARDHRPDHLAILPDQVGACSVAMGAGLCRNSISIDGSDMLLMPSMIA